ncbi:MAG TPA: phosphate signaling complex protein PhoU [Paracoccus sp.]|nr:phosphate signaling complex protein PhoU [Paracoccus sp. (in: a-proteobacteria)]
MMDRRQHIVTAFDRDLETIEALLARMGGLVEAAVVDAICALETRDEELAETVRRGDKAIDALEEQIDVETARLIALRAPTASDLRYVLATMKIAAALERCGDYAKNLARRSTVLAQMPAIDGASGSIRRMGDAVRLQMKSALDAFIQRDLELAEQVRLGDHDVDQMYNTLFREFLTHMMEDPRNITACMHLHFIAKNIERMGDHITGIAEQVIYLITGSLPDDERPKADHTALAAHAHKQEGAWQSP